MNADGCEYCYEGRVGSERVVMRCKRHGEGVDIAPSLFDAYDDEDDEREETEQ